MTYQCLAYLQSNGTRKLVFSRVTPETFLGKIKEKLNNRLSAYFNDNGTFVVVIYQ